ncbi:MAG: SUMF1/EgtB/PvdO family nonheme iron enzyme [Anaerolineae bacterium]|jgi:formylglycine-generating enzyme required for sulfatase activity|nr:SUMF1/EgtB/PvdO family nonheme iron enzyme [Anaerolineae bacterium]
MNGFGADYLANLTAELTAKVLDAAGRKVGEKLIGTEEMQAVRRCIDAGVFVLLAHASGAEPESTDLLQEIFTAFFEDPVVISELKRLLRGRSWDREELRDLFARAGYDAATLPELRFEEGLDAFEAAFLSAAGGEPALQGVIQTGHLIEQLHVQQALLDEVKSVAASLRELKSGGVGIRGGMILDGQGIVVGDYSQSHVVINYYGPTDPHEKELRQAYLNHLFAEVSPLALSGIDPKAASDAKASLNLSAVYTALLTLTPEECDRMDREGCPEKGGHEARRLSALEHLDVQPRLVLLGDPGSGKSTFVNFVALCLAGEALGRTDANLSRMTEPLPAEKEGESPQPQPWSHKALLPVRVVLRDFAARGLPPAGQRATASHLYDFMETELKQAELGDYLPVMERELRGSGGLLLLDGLDEVPEADRRREQIKQVVADFAAAFPACRILVTSRTYAYQQQAWRLPDFAEAVLAPFTPGQVRRFVDHWYAHVAQLRGLAPAETQGRAELLKQAIFASERLQGLAERPLLLTLMASLHAWRGGSLPEKREELYADAVDLLLDWWGQPKTVHDAAGKVVVEQPSLAEWLRVDRQKVRALLEALAYEAHAAQPALVGTADVPEESLINGLLRVSQNPDVKLKRLMEHLSQRAGLLLPRGVGIYTFPHRTFQEYLAACYLTDHGYPEQVAKLARTDPDRWREVALLAGAKSARGSAFALWALVEQLCLPLDAKRPQAMADAWGALLAGQALVENAALDRISDRDRPKVARVQAALVRLIEGGRLPAIERAEAGNALAKLGDPRFRADAWFLPDEPLLGFVEILEGPFKMGEGEGEHEVTLPTYYMGRYPVTVAQFGAFVKAGGYREPRYWEEAQAAGVWKEGKVKGLFDDNPRSKPVEYAEPFGLSNHPVVKITWYEALAYCRWLTEVLREWKAAPDVLAILLREEGWQVQLPSEGQWEKAARGTDGRIYPWGATPDPDRANYDATGIGVTSTVGCFPGGASSYGVEDLSGNVWEWTSEGDADFRVLRGGAFNNNEWLVRCAWRRRDFLHLHYGYFSFRPVLSPCL